MVGGPQASTRAHASTSAHEASTSYHWRVDGSSPLPSGPRAMRELLELALPGIDANDLEKMGSTLRFFEQVTAQPDGRPVKVRMKHGTVVSGDLLAVDAKQSALVVQDLETPLGKYPTARLETSDVLSIEVDLSEEDMLALVREHRAQEPPS